jgi:signal transduction histidine kinase
MLSTTELDLTDVTVESAVRALEEVIHERYHRLSEEHGRRLVIPETPAEGYRRYGRIRWNREIVQSLVAELIINAVKYSPEDSPIALEFATVDAAPHPHFSIQVRNHAKAASTVGQDGQPIVGVPEEYSELVFELFYTIDSFPTTLEGEQWKDGTGLYFVRSLARAMGGWADIRSGVDYVDGTARPQVVCELRLPLV